MTRKAIITAARTWLGTPYRHLGRCKGSGVDCIGLIIGVSHEVGYLPDYDITTYSRDPEPDLLQSILAQLLDPIDPTEAQPGDVLLLRFTRLPQHTAIMTNAGMIHAYAGSGRVVEHSIDAVWQRRILAAYRFPEVDAWEG